jgi:hypothetical protein
MAGNMSIQARLSNRKKESMDKLFNLRIKKIEVQAKDIITNFESGN